MTPQPLPDFLADLSFSLGGNTLRAFTLKDPKVLHFGLDTASTYSNVGFSMHVDGH